MKGCRRSDLCRAKEREKERHPTTQGKCVVPCVVETFGRIGPQFLALLDKITHLAQKYHSDLAGCSRNLKDDLLTDLSATLNKVIAKNYATCAAGAAHGHAPPSALFKQQTSSLSMRFHSSPLTAVRNIPAPLSPPHSSHLGHLVAWSHQPCPKLHPLLLILPPPSRPGLWPAVFYTSVVCIPLSVTTV